MATVNWPLTDIILMHKTYKPICFVFCFNFDKWEYENIQIKLKLLAKVGVLKSFFEEINKHGNLLFLLACWTQH